MINEEEYQIGRKTEIMTKQKKIPEEYQKKVRGLQTKRIRVPNATIF